MTSVNHSSTSLDHYQEIADITAEMVSAAQAGDWALVISLGQDYGKLVELLRHVEPHDPLDNAGRARKYDLLVQILENDACTRDLAVPQLARLGELLGRLKRQQSLLSTYGNGAQKA